MKSNWNTWDLRGRVAERGGRILFKKTSIMDGKIILHSLKNAPYGGIDDNVMVSYTYNGTKMESYATTFSMEVIRSIIEVIKKKYPLK